MQDDDDDIELEENLDYSMQIYINQFGYII